MNDKDFILIALKSNGNSIKFIYKDIIDYEMAYEAVH
jgi:hypothetical protein